MKKLNKKFQRELQALKAASQGYQPRTRGIFFHSDFSTEETKLKINIHLSRVKASGLSWIPSVTPNVPKNELK